MNGYGKEESVVGGQGSSQVTQAGGQLPRAQETLSGCYGGVVQHFYGRAESYNIVFNAPGRYTLDSQPSVPVPTTDLNTAKPVGSNSSGRGQAGLPEGHRPGSGYGPGSSGNAPGDHHGGRRSGGAYDSAYSTVGGGARPSRKSF